MDSQFEEAVMAHANQTLKGLDELIVQTQERLAKNPDYIALRALEKARAEIATESGAKMIDDVTGEELALVPTGRIHRIRATAPSQLEAAEKALEKAGIPLSTPVLVERVKALGAKVGGDTPNTNLGSTLSRSETVYSTKWKGEPAWWLVGRALPKED
jgi:hypothetical protein